MLVKLKPEYFANDSFLEERWKYGDLYLKEKLYYNFNYLIRVEKGYYINKKDGIYGYDNARDLICKQKDVLYTYIFQNDIAITLELSPEELFRKLGIEYSPLMNVLRAEEDSNEH